MVAHGGNTGLVGGGVPDGALIISLDRMTHIETVDVENLTVLVEAGAILANVQRAAKDAGVYFPLSLGAEGSCQIGGNLSTNAGGVHVLRYGNAGELVLGLEVVLPDGRIWNGLKALRKDNTGYNLKALFLGAEGTLGIITRAVLRLYPAPKTTALALIGCSGFEAALKVFHTARNRAADVLNACEVISGFALDLAEKHIEAAKSPLEGRHEAYLLIEFSSADADADLNALMEAALTDAFEATLIEDAVIAQSGPQADGIWALREAVPDAQKLEGGSIKHDVSVPTSKVPEFIEQATALVEKLIPGVRVCAFGHLGDGNIHFNLSQPETMDKQAFLDHWQSTNRAVHDLVAGMGGSFSAEHGVGQLKKDEMKRLKDPVELDLMRAVKNSFDSQNLMNPGKVLPDLD
jgi:FAD/FMN-containing dehydrogenase